MVDSNCQSGDSRGKSVVAVGCGNIGSYLIPHLGRMPIVSHVMLIDADIYEPENQCSQDITPEDFGRPKAVVQAHRLRRINPALNVTSFVRRIQDIPLGHLRCDVVLACLDSRESRRYVNEVAWRLGVPWIDSGVEPGGLLVRVQVFMPGPEKPCLECMWDERDYELLEQAYPCRAGSATPASTNALSSLGALAASLQAIECHKLLTGRIDGLLAGRELLLDAAYHKHYVTTVGRNTRCRFDHVVWPIIKSGWNPDTITLGEVLEATGATVDDHSVSLRVENQPFVTRIACTRCSHVRNTLCLKDRLQSADRTCDSCDGQMMPVGFEMLEALDARHLPERWLSRSLSSIGFRQGDVYTIAGLPDGPNNYYEVGE